MENTSAVLFDNSRHRFFLAIGGKAVGPLTTQELYDRLSRGECHFLNYVWAEGWPDWRTVSSVEDFKDLLPRKPQKTTIEKIQARLSARKKAAKAIEDAPSQSDAKCWYLHFGGSQFGPFSEAELSHVIEAQNVDDTAHVWKQGFSHWKKIKEVPALEKLLKPSLPQVDAPPPFGSEAAPAPVVKLSGRSAGGASKKSGTKEVKNSERRSSPRKPLVARLFLSNDKEVVVAVCRDVSIGGMQVLTDHVPGEVGTVLKLNVSPAQDSKAVKGFVAEGEIVRVLEDGRGFSFRFTRLSEDARKAIGAYVKAGG